jgi:hypothetical protein
MQQDTNEHIQIARLQEQILEHLGLTSAEAIFEHSVEDGKATARLITINPEHNQSFLFHTATGTDKTSALRAMLDYTLNYRDKEHSYTIQWAARGSNRLETSYFRGSDIYEVLHKFSYGRDRSAILIYSVSLNPIT